MDFETFVTSYLDGRKPPANLGRQSRFVSDRDGAVGVDRLFRYENLDQMLEYVAARMKIEISLTRSNVSPEAHACETLSSSTRRRLYSELAEDYDIYDSI